MARPTPLSHGGSGWDTYIESVFTDLYGGGAGTPAPPAAYGPRSATVVVAASNSVGGGADYVCTGANDHTTINTAIASLPAQGGRVLLKAGLYVLGAEVVINVSNVALEGEGWGFWGYYNTGNPGTGAQGVGVTELRQTGASAHVIHIDNTVHPATDGRLHGIALRNLYLYGSGTTGDGIYCNDASRPTDQLVIERVFVHKTTNGMTINGDTPHIAHNTIMDVSGIGIQFPAGGGAAYGYIADNVIADITGDGIHILGGYPTIHGNTIVRSARGIYTEMSGIITGNITDETRSDGLEACNTSQGGTITGNRIKSATGRGIWIHNTSNWAVTGNQVWHCAGGESIVAFTCDSLTYSGNVIESTSASNNGFILASCPHSAAIGNVSRNTSGGATATGFSMDSGCTTSTAIGNITPGWTTAYNINAVVTSANNV